MERESAVTRKLWIRFTKVGTPPTLAIPPQQQGLLRPRMAREQTHELETGITGGSENRGLYTVFHHSSKIPAHALRQ